MDAYGRAKFKNYHHVACNFDLILAQADKQQIPPADFVKTIAPVDPPPAVAVQAVKECKADEMSFDDMEYILGYRDASVANTAAAAQVWSAIQTRQKNGTVRIQFDVKVVAANATVIDVGLPATGNAPMPLIYGWRWRPRWRRSGKRRDDHRERHIRGR